MNRYRLGNKADCCNFALKFIFYGEWEHRCICIDWAIKLTIALSVGAGWAVWTFFSCLCFLFSFSNSGRPSDKD